MICCDRTTLEATSKFSVAPLNRSKEASHLDLVVHRMWRDAIRSEEQLWAAVEDRTRYLGASKVGPMMLNAPKNNQKRGFSA